MHRLPQDEEDRQRHLLDLDEIARQGARRILAEALEPRSKPTSRQPGTTARSKATLWSFAMVTPGSVRSS